MGMRPRFHALPASTPQVWVQAARLAGWHTARTWLKQRDEWLAGLVSERMMARAGAALRRAAAAEPQLSGDATLDQCRSRMLEAVQALTLDPWRAGNRRTAGVSLARTGWRQQTGDEMPALVQPTPVQA